MIDHPHLDHYPINPGGLPRNWVWCLVKDVASDVRSGFPSGKHNQEGRGIPHLRPMNIDREGRIDLREVKYVSGDGDQRMEPRDVLFNNTNSPALIGKTAYFDRPGEWAYSNHMTRLRPQPGVSPRFLAYQLHFLWMSGYFRHLCTHHVNQASVAAKTLADRVPITLPPPAEQERIVAAIEKHFSHLDAGLGLLERARRNIRRLRSLTFPLVLSNDRWPWTTLGEIAEVVGGVTKDAKRQRDPAFVEVPYLRVANVQRGYLDLREVTTIRVPPDKAKALELQPGDVLFNEGGDRDKLGRGWIWEGQIEHCIHQNHVFRARLIDDEFDPKFVSMHGNSFGQGWFEKAGKQTTNLASLNLKTLKSFPVPAPSLDEQRNAVTELERRLTVLDSTLVAIDDAERRGQSLRRSILTQAFAGRLVPQDPDDEPASVLLERIAAPRLASWSRRRGAAGSMR